MRHSLFYALIGVFTLISPSLAQARGYGELGVHLATERTEDNTTAATTAASERHFRFDIATGWQSSLDETQSFSYGIVFKSERGLQNHSDLAGYGIGTFLGWYRGSFSLRVDYIVLAELKANSGIVETQFREGTGFAVEARWLQWFAEGETKFAVGPALAFTQMEYGKTRTGSLPETSATRKSESLTAGLRGLFIF